MVMNMAYGEKKELEDAVPEATPEEIDLYIKSHAHLPKAVFDPERWQKITGDLWSRVVTVMARGGRFQSYDKGYPGDGVRAGSFDEPYIMPTGTKYGKLINMYLEKNTGVKYAGTGKTISPIPTYVDPYMSFEGNVIDDAKDGYDLKMITYKDVRQTKSRTQGNYWLKAALPENFLVMNSVDAEQRGLSDGDTVHITSASNPDGEWDFGSTGKRRIEGKISVVEGMRPGVVAFALGFGHWANGAHDITIDGTTILGDARRLEGFHANAAMRTDPLVTNTCLLDPVGGSAVFYDTQIKVEKV
jgi:anaerobic selenocysteine-containing dehydrogenase